MRKIFIATALLLTVVTASAQKSDFTFQGGIDLGVPVHNLDGTSVGLGFDLLAHYRLSPEAAVTGDAGYTALLGKNGAPTTNLIPFRIGLRYYPSSNFFVGGKVGAGFISSSGNSVTTTAYSFGLGFVADEHIELGASYDGYSKNGTVGLLNLRFGYVFN